MKNYRDEYVMHNNVKVRRELLNLTQHQLADLVGIRQQSVCYIEKEIYDPSAYTAGLLCKALLCSFEDLFFFERK